MKIEDGNEDLTIKNINGLPVKSLQMTFIEKNVLVPSTDPFHTSTSSLYLKLKNSPTNFFEILHTPSV